VEANRLSYCEPAPKTDRAAKVLEMPMAELAVARAPIVTERPLRLRDRLIKLVNSVLME
jgi:hypothetical protein